MARPAWACASDQDDRRRQFSRPPNLGFRGKGATRATHGLELVDALSACDLEEVPMIELDHIRLAKIDGGLDAFLEYRTVKAPTGEDGYSENDALWIWD